MKIESIVVGAFMENTYFLIEPNFRKTIIVDPGGSGREIENFLKEKDLKPVKIINTHGHPDHVEANSYLVDKYEIPVLIHPKDAEDFGVRYDKELRHGDKINFAGQELKIVHTPGHTMGSICILGDGFMLTGDTLFAGGMGRTDLGGDMNVMMETLKTRFLEVPGETNLYPGHGPQTTMENERKTNPYLIEAMKNL